VIQSFLIAMWAGGLAALASPTSRGVGDPLRGPGVPESTARVTLVQRGMSGELLPLDAPPAIAALEALALDGESHERVQRLLGERARLMEDLVFANLRLLSQIEGVMAAGSPGEKLVMIREGLAALEPVRAWGRLDHRVAEALPAPARARFRGLIREYERASFEQARSSGGSEHRWQHRMARYWADLGWEIERAAERVLKEDERDFVEGLIVPLGLSPEQEGRIRARLENFLFALGRRPTGADHFRLLEEIKAELTIEQRWKLLGIVVRGDPDRNPKD
jgi:hypothetical protein